MARRMQKAVAGGGIARKLAARERARSPRWTGNAFGCLLLQLANWRPRPWSSSRAARFRAHCALADPRAARAPPATASGAAPTLAEAAVRNSVPKKRKNERTARARRTLEQEVRLSIGLICIHLSEINHLFNQVPNFDNFDNYSRLS